jgi:DNA-binding GntR family transcriptional regulator
VREALARLAADGLVEVLPNRGARVADVSPGDMTAAYEARLVIEPVAARLAAARRDDEGLAAMREAVADQRRVGTVVKEAYRANRRFHLALVEAADNPFLLRFVEAIWAGRIGVHVYLQQADPADLEADADEHAGIVGAVEIGDGEAAEQLTREHIERALVKLHGARDGARAARR